jgi:hypothetical protein
MSLITNEDYSTSSTNRHTTSSRDSPSDDARSSITAYHFQRSREGRVRSQSSAGRRHQDRSVRSGNFVRPRSPHYLNATDSFTYSSHATVHSTRPNEFPQVPAEYQHIETSYPMEVQLEEMGITSTSTSANLIDFYPSNVAMDSAVYTSITGEYEQNWDHPAPFDAYEEEPQHSESMDTPAPPSPTAQRYFNDHTPEERLRLGYPRFQSQEAYAKYIRQSTNQ